MPIPIVTETAPMPHCNLTTADVATLMDELHAYHAHFADTFTRPEHRWWSQQYLRGLLSDGPRKSIEPMALALGLPIRPLQHFIGQSTWAITPVLRRHHALVNRTLGMPDGVVLIDDSGMPKQGEDSVGVARQYCGVLGKVANCQVGVYLGYGSAAGYTLLDGQLYIPEHWFADTHAAKRQQTGMPPDLAFQTKPQIAVALLERALAWGELAARWVAADGAYGDCPTFRDQVAALGLWYFTAVASTTRIWRRHPAMMTPAGRGKRQPPQQQTATNQPYAVRDLLTRLPKTAWVRTTIKAGSKGPLVCDLACVRVTEARDHGPGPRLWMVIRRSVSDPTDVRYYLSNAPETIDMRELARMVGMRWPIESAFAEGKGEVGMDHYEVRSWDGWQHHMVLVMLAHHFLVWMRIRWQDRAPAVTLCQIRLLLVSVLPKPQFDAAHALAIVRDYHRRNHAAYGSHRTRTYKKLAIIADQEAQKRLRYPGRPPKQSTVSARV